MDSLPTGTVTFLFTDIEGSTKLAQNHPNTWEALRERHHSIMRDAVEANHGYVFQIIGDAFCVAFHNAHDGLCAAILAQRKLLIENWGETPIRVRMGLHTGAVEFLGVDYRGYMTLARVQRVMSIGHGGQILLSTTACELVRGELPSDVTMRDMGEHRLKGLLNPEHLWQVEIPDLPQDFPPLQSLNKIPNNLPVQLTSFIGREKEISEVRQALSIHRLVTLIGSGGSGKTRLSLEVAAEEIDHFSDGVWFIELAPLADPGLIPQTILAVLHLGEQAGKTPLKVLEEQLQSKKLLLILDNCEHLVESSARIVHALLVSTPDIKILTSSREALGVQGELAWHVPSLELPDPNNSLQMEQLAQYEAVRLLIDRATLVHPHFTVTNENAPAVAQICYRLDGIPLAIELAAARLKMLSPEQIAARLDDRFRLLTGGSRTALPRQQTLRAMIDWSYELLSEDEKLLLRRLAVFEGGWVLNLAEQICSDDRLESFDILDLLGHLVDKSLLAVHEDKTGKRYRILETVRQYAREKLFETGEVKALRDRHRDVYLALVEGIEPEIIRAQQRKWLSVIESELDNLRAAFRWSLENEQGEDALRFCSSLGNFWGKNNHRAEAALTSKQALALVKESDPLRGTFWYGATLLAYAVFSANNEWKLFSEAPYLPLIEQAHNIFCSLNIYTTTAPVLASSWLAGAYIDLDNPALAERYLLELYEKVKTAEYLWGIAWTKLSMAKLSLSKGDSVSWLALTQEALDLFTQVGDEWVAKNISENLIWQKYLGGEFEDVIMLSNQSIALYQKDDEPERIARCYDTLGHVALEKGDYQTSRSFFTDAANIFEALELDGQDILAKEKLAYLLHKEGRLQTARNEYQTLFTQVADRTDSFLFGLIHARYALVCLGEEDVGEARKSLKTALQVLKKTAPKDDIFWAYFGLGELARMEKHYTDALKHYRAGLRFVNGFLGYVYFPELINRISKAECLQLNFEKAVHLLGISEALRKKMGVVIHPVDQPDHDKHIRLLKSQMSTEAFEHAWAEGVDMSIEEAYEYALHD